MGNVADRPIVILGPTAGGKSDLAAALALRLGGQVVGADSMQIYRHMDAGTAKPAPQVRRRVPHHLIDIVEPADRFTVADWLGRAQPLIAQLMSQGVRPIVVGGTNLYIKALLEGLFDGPPPNPALRAELARQPAPDLHQRLRKTDPDAAARIHPNDQRRIIRALEVYELTGTPISQWQTQWTSESNVQSPKSKVQRPKSNVQRPKSKVQRPKSKVGDPATAEQGAHGESATWDLGPGTWDLGPGTLDSAPVTLDSAPVTLDFGLWTLDYLLIGLEWSTDAINRRINARVKAMFDPPVGPDGRRAESLPDEVRRLEAAGLLGPPGGQARQALGYKQVLDHLAGRTTIEQALEQTKIATRRFAKSQRTWLRRFRDVHWLVADESGTDALANAAEKIVSQ